MINSQVLPCVAISVTQYDQRIATQNWSKASNFLPEFIPSICWRKIAIFGLYQTSKPKMDVQGSTALEVIESS